MDENLREATEFPEKNETTAAEADEPKTKSIHFKVSAIRAASSNGFPSARRSVSCSCAEMNL